MFESRPKIAEEVRAGIVANATAASAPPPVFKADHPFIFMIKDNKTDAILFLGQVNKP